MDHGKNCSEVKREWAQKLFHTPSKWKCFQNRYHFQDYGPNFFHVYKIGLQTSLKSFEESLVEKRTPALDLYLGKLIQRWTETLMIRTRYKLRYVVDKIYYLFRTVPPEQKTKISESEQIFWQTLSRWRMKMHGSGKRKVSYLQRFYRLHICYGKNDYESGKDTIFLCAVSLHYCFLFVC